MCLIEAAADGAIECRPLGIVQLVTFVVDDEIEDRPLWQVSRLVHEEPAVSDGGAHAHSGIVRNPTPRLQTRPSKLYTLYTFRAVSGSFGRAQRPANLDEHTTGSFQLYYDI
jgi:hypothetical protein